MGEPRSIGNGPDGRRPLPVRPHERWTAVSKRTVASDATPTSLIVRRPYHPRGGRAYITTSTSAQRLTSVLRVAPRPSRPPWCVARGREDASQAALGHSRKWECNSVCARGLLLKSLSSLLYILSGEPIIEKVFSYWIYFLARLPTTSGPVGWGLCGCDCRMYTCSRRRVERAATPVACARGEGR